MVGSILFAACGVAGALATPQAARQAIHATPGIIDIIGDWVADVQAGKVSHNLRRFCRFYATAAQFTSLFSRSIWGRIANSLTKQTIGTSFPSGKERQYEKPLSQLPGRPGPGDDLPGGG
jgi:hypothetical protein